LVDVQDWTHPPFSGVVADGFVWGRGAMDVKVSHSFAAETVRWKKQQHMYTSVQCHAAGALFE
jgi:acetylornithine deacetylase/succinyl-diaminopimelate desuccinylase-like protein